MGAELSFEQFADSQKALQEFIDAIDDTDDTADVTVKEKDTIVYSEQNCQVHQRIETNYSHVDIIWNGEKTNSQFPYFITYRNDYQVFKSYKNILTILQANDRNGKDIEIEIRKQSK